ncbi:hypothetical protein [Trujillonella humicola]|uniref:hypothetical protein n=1 Tax=Trujillonella humicola TaxID=3383699 RepID=UPI003905EE0D
MRFWRPLEETPAWTASRAAQGFYLFCVVFLIAGFVASFTVGVESAWIRPFAAVLTGLAALMLVALFVRSLHVRRYYDEAGGHHGGPEA